MTRIVLLTSLAFAFGIGCIPRSRQISVTHREPANYDQSALAARLSRVLSIRTISQPEHFDATSFLHFHTVLTDLYPASHQALHKEIVSTYSLLYTWPGTRPELAPAIFTGHFDAAPIEAEGDIAWKYPPFEAQIAEGFVWARGAMHSKFVIFGLLEATEALVRSGFRPERTLYFAFGHDDDLLGSQGAAAIGKLLAERNVRAEFVLEEGGMLVGPAVSDLPFSIAQLCVAEKGYLTVSISAKGKPGHSAIAPRRTAIDEVAYALTLLREEPLPARLTPPVRTMAEWLAPEVGGFRGIALANLSLFGSSVLAQLQEAPETNALVQTTSAATLITGGVKDNVIPTHASATLNLRLLPGDTVEQVLEEVRARVSKASVIVESRPGFAVNPLPPSSPDTAAFQVIHRSIREVFPEVRVIPSLLVAITDVRHYAQLSSNLYRFNPVWMREKQDTLRLHGTDERLPVADLPPAIDFYQTLLRNAGAPFAH